MDAPRVEQDPWTRVRTVHGFWADELVSTLQKSIRRGLVENAALVAYEMYASGAEAEDQVWSRLRIISVEDVGFGNLNAPVLIRALDDFRRGTSRQTPDRLIFLIHAVRVLATSQKDRTSDEMATWVRQAVERGEAQPDVFDVALDMHTRRGRELGRGFQHWFAEGARVENEIPDRDLTYRRRLEVSLDRPGGAQ
jgi:replication-associated recombination protein RarA